MLQRFNWDPCVVHRDKEADDFLTQYFALRDRNVFLIAGAGFDPRSTKLCERLSAVTTNLRAIFIREQRPEPDAELVKRADQNVHQLQELVSNHEITSIDIFGYDSAVVGGRNIVRAISRQNFEGITDIVVDISAMSVGTSYPMVRYLFEHTIKASGPRNLHLFVMPDAVLDDSIVPIAGDTVGCVHGFRGGWALAENAGVAKLWLPQLAFGRRMALQKIFDFIAPNDTCPILPFPSSRPRLGDELGEHYLTELESTWDVDHRNIVYAAEDDPLDIYRTILRIDDLRRPVFEDFGGSLLVLSPTGSKILALGALMAALERDLPVVYLESIGYAYTSKTQVSKKQEDVNFTHIWLEGEAYSSPRINYVKRCAST